MKPTKRPKRVKITYEKFKSELAVFICPSCKTEFRGFGPRKNVTRFVCECGQELIVDNKKE